MLLYVYHFWKKIKRKHQIKLVETRTELYENSESVFRTCRVRVGKVGYYYMIPETEWSSKNYVRFVNNGIINAKKVKILSNIRPKTHMVKVIILEDNFDNLKGRKIEVDARKIITCSKEKDIDPNALFINCKFVIQFVISLF